MAEMTAAEAGAVPERVGDGTLLVQCVTNNVAMNFAANAVIASGGAPAMVHAAEEAEDFAGIASAPTINIGTISPPWVEGRLAAIGGAQAAGRPWVLGPVAVGATPCRTEVAERLRERGPTAIRGNASEIFALSAAAAAGRGVDAGDTIEAAARALRQAVDAGRAGGRSISSDKASDEVRA